MLCIIDWLNDDDEEEESQAWRRAAEQLMELASINGPVATEVKVIADDNGLHQQPGISPAFDVASDIEACLGRWECFMTVVCALTDRREGEEDTETILEMHVLTSLRTIGLELKDTVKAYDVARESKRRSYQPNSPSLVGVLAARLSEIYVEDLPTESDRHADEECGIRSAAPMLPPQTLSDLALQMVLTYGGIDMLAGLCNTEMSLAERTKESRALLPATRNGHA
jgi:hypothetical protein